MPPEINYSKLDIVPDIETQDWWAGTKQHKYLVRLCNDCGHKWFPPSPICSKCISTNVGWFETSGKGTLYSYLIVTQAVLPAFALAVPYVVGLIELEDCRESDGAAVRVIGVLMDNEEEAAIGLPVQVTFEEPRNSEFVFPRWKINGSSPDAWKFTR